MLGLETVDKNSTPVGGKAAELLDNVPTYFSIIMASVVSLEVVDKISTSRK